MAPNFGILISDVKDVAKAHVLSLKNSKVNGRRLLIGSEVKKMLEISKIMQEEFPRYAKKLPKKEMPNFMLKLISYLDSSAKLMVPELGILMQTDTSYAEDLLGIKFKPARDSIKDAGNSVIVVEHDEEMMLASDHLVDIGPGAGKYGGKIVTQGPPSEHLSSDSITAAYLRGDKKIDIPKKRRKGSNKKLILHNATGNNLKGVSLTVPLGTLVCVTGVSGSGKSSIINNTLYPALLNHLHEPIRTPLPHDTIKGLKHLDKSIAIDQTPIGRTPRSNPATYTGIMDHIRKLFTMLPESRIRGYKPGRFSFNVIGGRCEDCKGAGVRTVEMNFLPNVHVPCDSCAGRRFNRETLDVRYKGKSISDVLDMTVSEAAEFFDAYPKIKRIVSTLKDVGLGYISLGQPSTTLSGGEAQRVKLAAELARVGTGNTLYILDEPTTGLHFSDVQMLLDVLNRLVNQGNTVLVIEHNLDVIKVADHVIDLGPEGGDGGGNIVASGTPEQVACVKESHTGNYLSQILH